VYFLVFDTTDQQNFQFGLFFVDLVPIQTPTNDYKICRFLNHPLGLLKMIVLHENSNNITHPLFNKSLNFGSLNKFPRLIFIAKKDTLLHP